MGWLSVPHRTGTGLGNSVVQAPGTVARAAAEHPRLTAQGVRPGLIAGVAHLSVQILLDAVAQVSAAPQTNGDRQPFAFSLLGSPSRIAMDFTSETCGVARCLGGFQDHQGHLMPRLTAFSRCWADDVEVLTILVETLAARYPPSSSGCKLQMGDPSSLTQRTGEPAAHRQW